MSTPLRTTGLTTGYRVKRDKVVVARDINASLRPGELTCLLGPNGAGKSTLLRTLCGFLTPLSGSVESLGRDLRDYSAAELARVIGVVLTDRLSVANMTAEELVGMGRAPYTGFMGRLSEKDRLAVTRAIDLVGIEDLRKRAVATLSDGERQKVMIAKALAQETPVMLLDEPTAFLDYPSKVEIMRLLHELSRQRKLAVLLSTHDLELALQIADRIWLIDKMHGLSEGIPEDLALNGSIAKYFERDGVEFDINTGLLRIARKMRRTVCLRGEGAQYAMVVKALRRLGIDTQTEDTGGMVLTATAEGFKVDDEEVSSVEAVIDAVRDKYRE